MINVFILIVNMDTTATYQAKGPEGLLLETYF